MTGEQSTFSFRAFKRLITIGQVLAACGLAGELRVRGDQLVGPCLLHGGDNPTAFRVHLDRGLWRCFTTCGGDVVELVRRVEGCDYAEATRHLARLAGDQRLTSSSLTGPANRRESTTPFRPFLRLIPLDPRADFLQGRKGIHVATAARFEAGWTDRSTFLRGTVAVRLHDLDGRTLGYCGRRLEPDQIARFGKWRFPAGFPKSTTLFNAHRALAARPGGLVVECPWAVMRLAQAGIHDAVALLGTAMSDAQAAWLAAAPAVLLMLDGDQAGRKAADAIVARLSNDTTVALHRLPDGCEPEDLDDHQLAEAVEGHDLISLNQYRSSRAS